MRKCKPHPSVQGQSATLPLYLVVELAVDWVSVSVDKLEGVRPVAVHAAVAVWGATVTEQEGDLVGRLLAESNEVPKHVWVLATADTSQQ